MKMSDNLKVFMTHRGRTYMGRGKLRIESFLVNNDIETIQDKRKSQFQDSFFIIFLESSQLLPDFIWENKWRAIR